MKFNSLDFLLFFPVAVMGFFAVPHRFRWILLLGASYFFYGYWRPEYLILIAISTLIDYWAGLMMGRKATKLERRPYLWASLFGNLGLLFVFKYAAFANENLRGLFQAAHADYPFPAFELLLPVGISFYTFQTLSYSIDVYNGRRGPERHLGIFAVYVSFFPQLVAGPIERSTQLLPQFRERMRFDWDNLRTGVLIMLWGFFLKCVIADRAGNYVDHVYSHPGDFTAVPLVLATYLFMYQILGDFAGYSLIAIGSARVMGYSLSSNFNRPFAARTLSQFWERWHMTLTSWIRDYCYRPLARLARSRFQHYLALLFVWLLFGLWHGAAWHFVLYGLYAGLAMIAANATKRVRGQIADRLFPAGTAWSRLYSLWQVFIIYHFAFFLALLFRVERVGDIEVILTGMVGDWHFARSMLVAPGFDTWELLVALAAIGVFELVQWLQERRSAWMAGWRSWDGPARAALFYALIVAVLLFGEFGTRPFIYFQF